MIAKLRLLDECFAIAIALVFSLEFVRLAVQTLPHSLSRNLLEELAGG
jgi:hypothetical protein